MAEEIILVGEPMALFMADTPGCLENVTEYNVGLAGAEFNVAIGLARLGHKASYMTRLGSDPFGKLATNLIKKAGIDASLVTYSKNHRTGMMLKSLVDDGDPEIYYYRAHSAMSYFSVEDFENVDFSGYGMIHMTGILPALSDSTRAASYYLMETANKMNIKVTFDPNLRPQLWTDRYLMIHTVNQLAVMSDAFLPGMGEAKILTGKDTPEEVADYYLGCGCKLVVIKLGAKGCYVANEEESFYVPGFKVEKIVDTVGAGDGFASGFVSGMMEGLSLYDSAVRANAIGAIQLMSRDDNSGLPTKEKLDEFIKKNS